MQFYYYNIYIFSQCGGSQTEGQNAQSNWFSKLIPGGKCSNCEALKRQLEQKEAENRRLAIRSHCLNIHDHVLSDIIDLHPR